MRDDTHVHPKDWPWLAVSPDQGPDGFCFVHYALGPGKMNLQVFWDPSHGVWRDQEQAMRKLGLHGFAVLAVVSQNLGHGPWDSQSRFQQMLDAQKEYIDTMALDCPLIEKFSVQLMENYSIDIMDADDTDDVPGCKLAGWAPGWLGRSASRWVGGWVGGSVGG